MQTYWDLTKKQRAALTEDDVRHYLDIELMQAGVVRPRPPTLEAIEPVDIPKRRFFGVTSVGGYDDYGLLFESESQALEFIKLNPLKKESDWSTDSTFGRRRENLAIVPVDVAEESIIMAARQVLVENKNRKARNEKAAAEYEKARAATQKAEESIWEDWSECRDIERKIKKIVGTLDEYLGHTGGNEKLALTFLKKAFPWSEVVEALEWSGRAIPMEEPEGITIVEAPRNDTDKPVYF